LDLYLDIAGGQIAGARDYQEDAFLTTYLDDHAGGDDAKSSALVVMADGMGGHAAGNIASNLVVSTFNNVFTNEFGKHDVPAILRECLEKANNALRDSIRETPALDGMGCTMVTAALTRGKLWWVSVGDSHLYLVRGGELVKKNEDHSYGGYLDRMKAQGMDIEPEPGLSRNMLMSAMTGDEVAEVDCPEAPLELKPGDRIIIASDGLDTLSEGGVLQYSSWAATPKECVDALLKAVEEAKKPRQDNTTVVVIDVVERGGGRAGAGARTKSDSVSDAVKAEETARAAESVAPPAAAHTSEPAQTEANEATVEPRAGPAADTGSAPGPAAEPRAEPPAKRGGPDIVDIALVAVVVLGIVAAGAWFMLGSQEPEPSVATEAPETVPETAGEPEAEEGLEIVESPEGGEGIEIVGEPEGGEGIEIMGEPQDEPELVVEEPAGDVEAREPEEEAELEAPEAEPSKPAATLSTGDEFRDPLAGGGDGPLMVVLPGGRFAMGSAGFSAAQDELPQHTVTVKPFAMSKHEVTFAEYERFARATGRPVPESGALDKASHPVVGVSWDDALNYTKWLSEQTGERYRLPSEAEWEYAARGGTGTIYWWGNEAGSGRAHCFDCDAGFDVRRPTQVGRFEPNPFGLYDTAGNVAEWAHDCYKPTYVGAPTDGSVWEHGECTYRVTRGGAYETPSESVRPSARQRRRPAQGYDAVGIRVVRDF